MSKPFRIFLLPDTADAQLQHDDGLHAAVGPGGLAEDGRPYHLIPTEGMANGHGAWLTIAHPDRPTTRQHGVLFTEDLPTRKLAHPDFAEFVVDTFDLRPFERRVLPRVMARGKLFGLEMGARFSVIECSDFNLGGRLYGGEDIDPVLRDRDGFNTHRIWLLYDVAGVGTLRPSDHPHFYDDLPLVARKVSTHGRYLEVTIFTGTQRLLPSLTQQQDHLNRCVEALRGESNVAFYELVNEDDQGDDKVDDRLTFPPGVLLSGGSVSSDTWPTERGRPILQYEVLHMNPAVEWPRKVGHECMEMSNAHGVPSWTNEYMRFPDRDSSLLHLGDAAASGVLLCAGAGCYHTPSGKASTLFTDQERQGARAFLSGAGRVPLEFQDGRYLHRPDLEGPDAGVTGERVYERRLADGRGHVEHIHA